MQRRLGHRTCARRRILDVIFTIDSGVNDVLLTAVNSTFGFGPTLHVLTFTDSTNAFTSDSVFSTNSSFVAGDRTDDGFGLCPRTGNGRLDGRMGAVVFIRRGTRQSFALRE